MNSVLKRYDKILIVAYEAGGAQILSSLVRLSKFKDRFLYCLAGPAMSIFEHKIGSFQNNDLEVISSLEEERDFVLTGSSLVPEWERNAIKLAKERGVSCATFVDHWVNYRTRFLPAQLQSSEMDDEMFRNFLPDKVIVSDEYGMRFALDSGIQRERLIKVPNPNFVEIRKEFEKISAMKNNKYMKKREKTTFLYASEPIFDDFEKIYGDGNYWGYTEWDVAECIVNFVRKYHDKIEKFILRLHPNEALTKYDDFLSKYPEVSLITISKKVNILDDLDNVDIVIGADTMALVIGLICGKEIFSFIPKGSKRITRLPHKEIIRINNLEAIWEKVIN